MSVSSSLPTSREKLFELYNELFTGLGQILGEVHMQLQEKYSVTVQYTKRIPLALHKKLKQTLDSLDDKDIVESINYPTEWVNILMLVEKPDHSLKICPKPLNKFICREHFLIPTSETILGRLTGKSTFTVIDMQTGF